MHNGNWTQVTAHQYFYQQLTSCTKCRDCIVWNQNQT